MNDIARRYEIMIVGEAWGEKEAEAGEPFVGPSGGVLKSMLRHAGVSYDDCYVTNVFNLRPAGNKLESLSAPKSEAIPGLPQLGQKLWISARYKPEIDRLLAEIETIRPNVILALGATPLWAICHVLGIKKYRGTPIMSADGKVKVLPTYHPAAVMRQWKLRPIVIADIAKARAESLSPQLVRPRRFIYLEPSIADIEWFYETYIAKAEIVSADIETKQGTITEIGFAPQWDRALVIPFYSHSKNTNYWSTPSEEFAAWKWVQRICAEKRLVGQNFSYDLQYLWDKNHIPTVKVEDDTMILHHAMYPEMEKSLGFLGSIYTDEPSWKFMRADNETLKQED